MRLENKVAIVTGGSSGIGYAIVKAYLKEGAKVVIASYDQNEVSEAVESLKEYQENLLGLKCDVRNLSDIKNTINETINKFGKIDILVNNAGITNANQTENVTDEELINTFEVNTFGPFKFIREVIPYMKEKGGAIINTSSLAGTYGSKMQAAYSASKFAVNGLTKSCAKELGAYNIRVNAVAPGAVMTNITKGIVNASNAEIFKEIGQGMKLAKPEELAGAYVYLASDEASFTTGAILAVDGGSIM